VNFIAASVFTFSLASAQTNKNQTPARPAEQKEIRADNRLEKEMQQKQLSAKPELLEENKLKEETKKIEGKNSKSIKSKNKQIKRNKC
jgi:hypothetical protein